jgi:hypothetical protein
VLDAAEDVVWPARPRRRFSSFHAAELR